MHHSQAGTDHLPLPRWPGPSSQSQTCVQADLTAGHSLSQSYPSGGPPSRRPYARHPERLFRLQGVTKVKAETRRNAQNPRRPRRQRQMRILAQSRRARGSSTVGAPLPTPLSLGLACADGSACHQLVPRRGPTGLQVVSDPASLRPRLLGRARPVAHRVQPPSPCEMIAAESSESRPSR